MVIKLERFSYEEIPQLISWIPNKEFLFQWAGPAYTFELLEKQLQKEITMMLEQNSPNLMFSAKLIESNEAVGHIQLLGIDRVLVGGKENRNKGIGVQMINAILDTAFNELNLHRVDLGVFDFNVSAIAYYKKVGFIIEGNFRECRKINGQCW